MFQISGLLLFTALLGVALWNQCMCRMADRKLEEVGKTVTACGTKIRAEVTGSGAETIVLLSGMGTPEPIVDFRPLAKALSAKYQVVTIEYPG